MDYQFKVWLQEGGQPVLGDGIYLLLTLIDQHGSIRKAADHLKMSYRQAWGNIKKTESRLGYELLIKQIGGESGGGAQLTPKAKELIANFSAFRQEVGAIVDDCFNKHFR